MVKYSSQYGLEITDSQWFRLAPLASDPLWMSQNVSCCQVFLFFDRGRERPAGGAADLMIRRGGATLRGTEREVAERVWASSPWQKCYAALRGLSPFFAPT